MKVRSVSSLALIGTTLLSNHRVLKLLQQIPFQVPVDEGAIREAVYLAYLPWAAREPDHVFERNWEVLKKQPVNLGRNWYMLGALQALANEFLTPRHGSLYVKLPKFGAWQQSISSRVCSLPIQAGGHTWPAQSKYLNTLDSPTWLGAQYEESWASEFVPVLIPYDSLVEDYLHREGLHETHLHLNGSTHAEQCWLRALHAPEQEIQDFEKRWNQTSNLARKVRELARSFNPEFSPALLRQQLIDAKNLRAWLVAAATDALNDNVPLPATYDALSTREGGALVIPAPKDAKLDLHALSSTMDELRWQHLLLKRLDEAPSIVVERMLHCYLLLQNQYYRLLVQNEEQFGFDQFQKLTWTNLREPAEKDYRNRFLAMHGKNRKRSRVGYLEGRFAPQDKGKRNDELLVRILAGYRNYIHFTSDGDDKDNQHFALNEILDDLENAVAAYSSVERRHMRLALVAHFIKQPWDSQSTDAGPYRFYSLRKDVEKRAHALISTLDNWPRLRAWLRGIDAAANELHTPPEVFASCYRICRSAGLTRRSYHVGEDFPHLLSGLRHILDALEILELGDGDRIGHGTAMGILPSLWMERMPDELVVTKGDWMLDLLSAWRLLLRSGATAEAYRVECETTAIASQIFGKDISCTALDRAMRFRGLHMGYLQLAQDQNWSLSLIPFNDIQYAEAERVARALHDYKQDVDLLWLWQSDKDLWKRSETLITVSASFFDSQTYLRLQQVLMREIQQRRVLVETLPSSNVRISQYENFSEHHSLRWMRVPGYVQEGDPPIMATLGSDDPGIFAGDLSSEFYQLYATLREAGFADNDALAYLSPINERGRQYRFHDPIIG